MFNTVSCHRKLHNALLATYAHSLYTNIVLPQNRDKRDEYCLELSGSLFPDVTAFLIKEISNNPSKKRVLVNELFKNLKLAFSNSINASEWLEGATKTSFLNTLDQTQLSFQEDFIDLEDDLESNYENFTVEGLDFSEALEMTLLKNRRTFYSLQGKQFNVKHV